MALLTRYKKSGGFVQILKLIETCGTQKQEKLLENIQNEDARWSKAIEDKMLTIDKIFSWPGETLGEVMSQLQDLTLAIAFHGLGDEMFEKSLVTFSHGQKKRIKDLMDEKEPTQAEISTAYMKTLEVVRNMISNGDLRIQSFAPELVIGDDIEESLDKMPAFETSGDYAAPEMAVNTDELKITGGGDSEAMKNLEKAIEKIKLLNAELLKVQKENNSLRHENHGLKKKLAQVKSVLAA